MHCFGDQQRSLGLNLEAGPVRPLGSGSARLRLRQFFLQRPNPVRHLAFFRRGSRDHDHADQHQRCAQRGSRANRFASQEISYNHRNHRIHVSVRANLGRRFVMDQPKVSGETDDRTSHDQVSQREPAALVPVALDDIAKASPDAVIVWGTASNVRYLGFLKSLALQYPTYTSEEITDPVLGSVGVVFFPGQPGATQDR